MICTLILNSCSLGGGRLVISDDSDKIADARLEQIINDLLNSDKDSLKALFSKKALNEANNFENNMEYLLVFFRGKVIEWKRNAFSAPEKIENGKESLELQSVYTVTTDKDKYMFFIIEYNKDTFNPDNIGLYTLRVIKAKDEDTQFTYWQDMKIPGIYKPKQ